MSCSCNKRNFKRRRNGRSHSIFNTWTRDKHKRIYRDEADDDDEKAKSKKPLSVSSSNYNYQKYGYGRKHFDVVSGLPSSSSPLKLTKANDLDEISTITTTLLHRPVSLTPPCPSNNTFTLPPPLLIELSLSPPLPTRAQLIRLLSLILRVTCISHYYSKLSSLLLPPPRSHQTYLCTSTSSSKEETMTGWKWRMSKWMSSCAGGESRRNAVVASSTCSSSSPVSNRVRCQISSVRSDFIYIIVFTLCVLSPAVTPIITSNAILPMDAPVPNDRADAEFTLPIEAVLGKRVEMPCEISPKRRDDSVYLVLWFRDDDTLPIYSLDVRGKHFSGAKHWSSDKQFGKRGHFQTTSEPARLIVEPVKLEDQSIYRCRVDFRNSPSRETRLNLTITVPPEESDLQIYENTGMNIQHREIGPYKTGSTIELTCIVSKGLPSPSLLWFLDDVLVDSSYHVENENQVINHISVPNIQRSQHRANLQCRASNTLLIPPVSKTVSIELNLRPLSVSILHRHSQLATDTQYEIVCESWGSHPAPVMTWFLGGVSLKSVTTEETRSSNTSMSRLLFMPVPEMDGTVLTCRAENPIIGEAMEDSWKLTVKYSPLAILKLGTPLLKDAIKEGDDVYFECFIKANPPSHKISWYKSDQLITHNTTLGVILSNQSLVLQSISRRNSGNYSCRATNSEGTGTSNYVELNIRYAPACRNDVSSTEGSVIIAASRSEDVNITCEMDTLPDNLRFHWSHTNSVGETVELEPEIYTSQGSKSFLFYNLRSEEDFGTLLCWAQNSIGASARPCVYQITPADCPNAVENCSIINRTSTSVEITCEPGYDGGLPQSFYLEAFQAAPHERRGLKFNISSSIPTFSLTGLDADGTFHFKIYSVNRRGKSAPSIMDGIALHYPAMQSAKVRDLEKTTIAIIIGAVSAVFLSVVTLVVFVVHRVRNPISNIEIEKSYSQQFRPSRRSSTNDELYHHNNAKKLTHPTMDMPFTAPSELEEDGDPDLIPSKNVKASMAMGKTYSRLSNGEINQRYGAGPVEKIPLRSMDSDAPLTMEQHSALSNYATFRPNGLGLKYRQPPPPRPIVSSTSGSFHGKPASLVVNIDTRLIGQQLASNQLPESCV